MSIVNQGTITTLYDKVMSAVNQGTDWRYLPKINLGC